MTPPMNSDRPPRHPGLPVLAGNPEPLAPSDPPRFLSKPMYAALLKETRALASPRGETVIRMDSRWRSDVRWGRNRTTVTSDWRNISLGVQRQGFDKPKGCWAVTNQLDAGSLQSAAQWAETVGQMFEGPWPVRPDNDDVLPPRYPPFPYPSTHIWSDVTFNQSYESRVAIVNELIADAEAVGMFSAGYLAVEAGGAMLELPTRYVLYAPWTEAQFSLTVRDPEGSGSGWAGVSSYDWSRIDAAKLAAIALDKCLKSRHPVRIEPGRYTVIMEPQATYGLLWPLFWTGPRENFLDLVKNINTPNWPFATPAQKRVSVSQYGNDVSVGLTRIGQRVFDERLDMYFEPTDPETGRIPFAGPYPIQPVHWIKNGILQTLSYEPYMHYIGWGNQVNHIDLRGKKNLQSFRLDSGANPTVSMEEMIATTLRGLLVTRFWGVQLVDEPSVLLTGTTRDGMWLIERGKISHPVTNLRFTESPMFAFNQVEQIGATVPVFAPHLPAAVPAIKVRDFSFTALENAI